MKDLINQYLLEMYNFLQNVSLFEINQILEMVLQSCILQKQPPEVFCKKIIPRNFVKFVGKHLCQSLFFN